MKHYAPEMIEKAKTAKTAEEILTLAKESGVEMTEEEAKACFAQLNPVSGELSDDELDNVSGGGCGGDDAENSPTMYYDVFTNGMKVHCGRQACLAYNKNGCMGQYHGVITFLSSTKWYCTCDKCGAEFNGSGDPRQWDLSPTR